MSDPEARNCPHCGKKLRVDNKRGACSACLAKPGHKPTPSDDSVLSRMGFKVDADQADEAPPATKAKRVPREKAAAAPRWQGQFRSLSSALGLDPDDMLERYCREWVEGTRARALAPPADPPKQLPAGELLEVG